MPGLVLGFIILLSASIASAQFDVCTFNPVVNGCSIPGELPAPYKTEFIPACNRHDICYACGWTNGISRAMCDHKFLMDMKSICASKPILSKDFCSMTAHIYSSSVSMFGNGRYHPIPHAWCKLPWISLCMPTTMHSQRPHVPVHFA